MPRLLETTGKGFSLVPGASILPAVAMVSVAAAEGQRAQFTGWDSWCWNGVDALEHMGWGDACLMPGSVTPAAALLVTGGFIGLHEPLI